MLHPFRTSAANSSCLIAHTKSARTHSELLVLYEYLFLVGYYRPSGDHGTFDNVGGIEVANLRRKLLRNSLQQGGFHILKHAYIKAIAAVKDFR
jgi:hypothetical protein